MVGNATSNYDLSTSFARDNVMISVLSVAFVILILLVILHIVKGTQSVYQLLSPQQTEVFLTDGQRVVHGFVQSQLENENKSLIS